MDYETKKKKKKNHFLAALPSFGRVYIVLSLPRLDRATMDSS